MIPDAHDRRGLAVNIEPPRWLRQDGPESDVVVSTRCRIARNLRDEPFPWRATESQAKSVAEHILDSAHRAGGAYVEAKALCARRLPAEDAARLVEWRYASRDWLMAGPNGWLLILPDGMTSILVNEEDHIRLQSISPGLLVESIQSLANERISALARYLELAKDEKIGYLTASLVNAGAGVRLSVLLHLPGLAASGSLADCLSAASALGCTIRGLYGEGSRGTGEFFQVSNTCTRRLDADEGARVGSAARYLVESERRARLHQFGSDQGRADIEAATSEALRWLFYQEAGPRRLLPLVSVLRLAVAEGVLPGTMPQTAEWVAIAGLEAALYTGAEPITERYEAIRRTAVLRRRLREIVGAVGTSG